MDLEDEVVLLGPDGKKVKCTVILEYNEDGRKYIVYTDGVITSSKILKSYVSEIDESGEEPKLINCTDMDILKRIQDKLNEAYAEMKKETEFTEVGE